MPFPKVTKKDTLKTYEEKCMSNPAEVKAFKDPKQRYAVCAEHFRSVKKKQK